MTRVYDSCRSVLEILDQSMHYVILCQSYIGTSLAPIHGDLVLVDHTLNSTE